MEESLTPGAVEWKELEALVSFFFRGSRKVKRTCLCLGSLLQMTYSRPFLRTTEQPSQNFLTLERTFIPLACCCITEDREAAGEGEMEVGCDFKESEAAQGGVGVGRLEDEQLRAIRLAVLVGRAGSWPTRIRAGAAATLREEAHCVQMRIALRRDIMIEKCGLKLGGRRWWWRGRS